MFLSDIEVRTFKCDCISTLSKYVLTTDHGLDTGEGIEDGVVSILGMVPVFMHFLVQK